MCTGFYARMQSCLQINFDAATQPNFGMVKKLNDSCNKHSFISIDYLIFEIYDVKTGAHFLMSLF